MVYHPQQPWAGRRVLGFVQHTDVMPTLLDILGVEIPSRVTGESLNDVRRDPLELENVNYRYPDLVKDFRAKLKEYADSGWEITRGTFAQVLPG